MEDYTAPRCDCDNEPHHLPGCALLRSYTLGFCLDCTRGKRWLQEVLLYAQRDNGRPLAQGTCIDCVRRRRRDAALRTRASEFFSTVRGWWFR